MPRSALMFLGVVIGGIAGGIGGAIAGFFISAIVHGALRGLLFRITEKAEEAKLAQLIKAAEKDPELAEKLHHMAALARLKRVFELYETGGAMPLLSTEEQQAHIMLLESMKTSENGQEAYNELRHKMQTVHFNGNKILGSHLQEVA